MLYMKIYWKYMENILKIYWKYIDGVLQGGREGGDQETEKQVNWPPQSESGIFVFVFVFVLYFFCFVFVFVFFLYLCFYLYLYVGYMMTTSLSLSVYISWPCQSSDIYLIITSSLQYSFPILITSNQTTITRHVQRIQLLIKTCF